MNDISFIFIRKNMNSAHIHLVITHLPIFGSILGGLVLVYGVWSKSDQTKLASYTLLIISSVATVVAYLTGEGAEETVERVQGIAKGMIDQHEDAAVFALTGMTVLGLVSMLGLYLTITKSSIANQSAKFIVGICIISFGFAAWAGYLGGQIRHTEIGTTTPLTTEDSEGDD